MKTIIILLTCALLLGCDGGTPQNIQRTAGNYEVKTLFTYDGCTIYSFHGNSYYEVYFTNCKGSTQYMAGGKSKHLIQTIGNT